MRDHFKCFLFGVTFDSKSSCNVLSRYFRKFIFSLSFLWKCFIVKLNLIKCLNLDFVCGSTRRKLSLSSQIYQLVLRILSAHSIRLLLGTFGWRLFPVVWEIVDIVFPLHSFTSFKFTVVSRRVLLCRVIIWIEIFWLPVSSDESASFFEICSKVEMFFFSLDLGLHSTSRLWPLIQNLFCLLVPSFFLKFPVLMFKPDCFEFLLYYAVGGVVVIVWGATFKPIFLYELNFLNATFSLVCRVKGVKRLLSFCFLCLTKRWSVRSPCHSLVVSETCGYFERVSKFWVQKTALFSCCLIFLLIFGKLSISLFYFFYFLFVLFKRFSLYILNSHVCGRNFSV